jgi:hypothetical protein
MRLKIRATAVFAVCILLLFQNANAWNSIGHMTVAYVAYQQLTPTEKARVAALLALNPNYKTWQGYIKPGAAPADQQMYVFMMAATWPDEIRGGTTYKLDGDVPPHSPEATANIGYTDYFQHDYWHFVDMPFTSDNTAPLPAVPVPNAETRIVDLRAALSSSEPDALKSYDLVWLLHLIGDVHQPLHCATRVTATQHRGDAGGNAVTLTGAVPELHAYWDSLLGVGTTQDFALALKAGALLPTADATAAADLNEADWVNESFAMAQKDVYVSPPIGPGAMPYTIAPDSPYAQQALKDAQGRVALAGARLANVLHGALAQ